MDNNRNSQGDGNQIPQQLRIIADEIVDLWRLVLTLQVDPEDFDDYSIQIGNTLFDTADQLNKIANNMEVRDSEQSSGQDHPG